MGYFAKLYETERGQILVMRDEGEEGPEVRFYCKPAGLGVCSAALGFKESDEGYDAADRYFDEMDREKAVRVAASIFERAEAITGASE